MKSTQGCAYADWEIDHLVSLAIGGADVVYNLFPEPGN